MPKKNQKLYTARSERDKGGPKLLPLVWELLTAVALTVLKAKVKAWILAPFVKRQRSAAEGAPLSPSAPQTHGDRPTQENKPKAGKPPARKAFPAQAWDLLKDTASQWVQDQCPQLGAALAYYTVFSLAPLVLVLLAVFGLIYGGSEHAREKITEQLRYFIDPSGVKVIQDIAANAAKPKGGLLASALGVIIALFGASGVFGQLQAALNTIWGVKPKPGQGLWGFVRARFLSFVCSGRPAAPAADNASPAGPINDDADR
jgi:hypothetical protein